MALSAIAQPDSAAHDGPPPGGAPHTHPQTALALLAGIQVLRPDAVENVLDDPSVAGAVFPLARRLIPEVDRLPAAPPLWVHHGVLGSLAAAAAVRGAVRCGLRVPTRRGQLWLPSLGVTGRVSRGDWAAVDIECGPDGAVVHGDCGSVRLPARAAGGPAEGWSPLHRIDVDGVDAPVRIALDVVSPYRDFRAIRSVEPVPVERWSTLLREAYAMLRRDHRAAHRAVAATIRAIAPVPYHDGLEPLSASSPDAPGMVLMSLSSDVSTLAATLVHEAHHQLLSDLESLVPLVAPARAVPEERYFAPWRGDPRPLRSLLFGAHAFAGVTSFWQRRMAVTGGREHDRALFEFALHRWQVRVALAALQKATNLTPVGAQVVTALVELARGWQREPTDDPAARLAHLCCRGLWAQWRRAHLAVDDSDVAKLAVRWQGGDPPPVPLPPAFLAHRHRRPADGWSAQLSAARRALSTSEPLPSTEDGALDLHPVMPYARPELVAALRAFLPGSGLDTPNAARLASWLDGT